MGTFGYVLSCIALDGGASRGPNSSGTYRVMKNPQVWPRGVWACADPGHKDKAV
jgi:hypothetical protein